LTFEREIFILKIFGSPDFLVSFIERKSATPAAPLLLRSKRQNIAKVLGALKFV
jgi:hypothetical protein